jgi:hypothetical protein
MKITVDLPEGEIVKYQFNLPDGTRFYLTFDEDSVPSVAGSEEFDEPVTSNLGANCIPVSYFPRYK